MLWHEHWWSVLIGILILPLLFTVAFGLWLRRQPDVSFEVGTKCWDAFIKLISAFTIIVSGAMLFGKYINQQNELQATKAEQLDRELALREADYLRQQILFDTDRHTRKLKLLTEAKTLAARIESMKEPDQLSLTRFDELYHSDLIGVEEYHGDVEKAMVGFREKLVDKGKIKKDSDKLTIELSTAVENELKKSEGEIKDQYRRIADLLKPKRVQ